MNLPTKIFNQNYFGLSITRTALRAISLNSQGKIVSYAQTALPPEILDGKTANSSALLNAINQIKSQGKFDSPYTSLVIPEAHAFSREYALPPIAVEEVSEAITWQLSKILPFSPNEMYIDWKLLAQDASGIRVLIVAIQKQLIDNLRQSLEAANIFPVSIEPSASAVSRILSFEKTPNIGLLEVDSLGSTAILVKNGISLLTTTSNIDKTQASDLKTTAIDATNALLKYYASKQELATQALPIFLTGERASEDLAKDLSASLKKPVSLLVIDHITPPFHQAYAAATTQVLPPESEKSINLIPIELQQAYQTQLHNRLFSKSLILAILAFVTSLMVGGILMAIQFMTLSNLNQQIKSLEQQQEATKVNSPAAIVKKAGQIKSLFPIKATPQDEIAKVINFLPPTIKLANLGYSTEKQKFELFATADTRQDILDYKNALEKSGEFESIKLPLGIFESATNIDFTFEFSLKPKANSEKK